MTRLNTMIKRANSEAEKMLAASAKLNKLTEQLARELSKSKTTSKQESPDSWRSKASPDKVISWIEKKADHAATVREIREHFRITERQWLKLRTALADAGCAITGQTNKRLVHAPGRQP